MPEAKTPEPGLLEQLQTLVSVAIAETEQLREQSDAKNVATNMVLAQMARNSTLLPAALKTDILNGAIPALEDIVTLLLIGAMDCHFAVFNDSASTWNEKRMSRAVLTNNFLSALAVVQGIEGIPGRL